MEASEKIINFPSLEELKVAISDDRSSKELLAQRYGVRFIMLNNFDDYREIVKFLTKELDVKQLEIESLLTGDDKWITIDMLRDAITSCTQSVIITPFSELARFYDENDFRGFFNDVILLEDLKNPLKRLYIPLIGLQNRFTDFLKSFGRIGESAPIWQCNTTPQKVLVYLSKFGDFEMPNTLELVQLSSMKSWLRFWKEKAPQSKIICSSKPIRVRYKHSKPDAIFKFNEIANAYQFITDFLALNVPIKHNPDEDSYWDALMESIDKKHTQSFIFNDFVCQKFNRFTIEFNDILDIWSDTKYSEYDRWLLKNYLLQQDKLVDYPYLKLCLSEIIDFTSYNALHIKIAERIFYLSSRSQQELYFNERYELMNVFRGSFIEYVPIASQDWIRETIVHIYQTTEDLYFARKFCTGTFEFEKALYLGWYVHHKDAGFNLDKIKEVYPDLYSYLCEITTIESAKHNWCINYFQNYKQAKLQDIYTESIKECINTTNQSNESFYQWYYSFNNSADLLTQFNNSDSAPDKIYWIDGLGAEFLPYILSLIEQSKSKYFIAHSEVARTNIPSNTHLNSFDVDGQHSIKFGELDQVAHKSHYRKYHTLIEELNTIKDIIDRILNDNSHGYHTIAIVSDHGLSALSRLAKSTKLSKQTNHEGRYLKVDSSANSEEDFVVHQNEKDGGYYRVALKHSSLGNAPTHEVHGGCTPEEVLVPFIVISNIEANQPIKYNIELKDTQIPISSPIVDCVIMPEPKSAIVRFSGKDYQMEKDGTSWKATIDKPEQGKYPVTIIPYRGNPKSLEIELYGVGFNENILDVFDF